jgi:hypothetical protein
MPPESAKAVSLARVGDTVNAEAAFSLSRTAMIVRPTPVRRTRASTKMMNIVAPRQTR